MAIDLIRLEESPHLIDLLIQMEDVLDSLDIYVFANWIHGNIIAGPDVRRYWLALTLEYPHDRKPDERGALRMIKHGLQVTMTQGQEGERKSAPSGDGSQQETQPVWIVELKIPRRLISDMNAGQLDFYDEEVDAEDVQDASDAGMTDETGYVDDEAPADPNAPTDETNPGAPPPAAPQGVNAPAK